MDFIVPKLIDVIHSGDLFSPLFSEHVSDTCNFLVSICGGLPASLVSVHGLPCGRKQSYFLVKTCLHFTELVSIDSKGIGQSAACFPVINPLSFFNSFDAERNLSLSCGHCRSGSDCIPHAISSWLCTSPIKRWFPTFPTPSYLPPTHK